ncbi:MAG: FG-GAP-like repeat-containing protein [Bacteroidales bacterium]|jgi:RHS repeat-associated protein|nr:FG-GAP-like repeat-containing protein [Bacteroidales bacterium]
MKYLSIYLLLLLSLRAAGQQSITRSINESGSTKEHIARDYVKFSNGYRYKATGSYRMRAAIDEHIVISADYQSTPPSEARGLNTSYAVGSTQGVAGVTPTGAATYQIPIAIPPGTGGVQPNLSLAYNSQNSNGLLGYGWNLAGVSVISRSGKTYHHDAKTEAIQLNNTDNLMLDGQRLMLASGTNLTNGAQYRTEIESFSEIACKTIGASLYFEVKTRDGWLLEYGTTTDSYIEAAGSSVPLCWLLAKVTDPSGNYMTYSYTENNSTGEFRLKQIDYTGNTGLSPYNRIEFFYEMRTDQETSYIAGNVAKQTVLLRRIKATSTNINFREYKFNYFFDGFYSKLTEIEEYGQNNVRFNSTLVNWGEGDVTPGEEDYGWIHPAKSSGSNILFGDFNGDGKTDFIEYPVKNSYTTEDKLSLYLATSYYGIVEFYKKSSISLSEGFRRAFLADMNGDGKMDVVLVSAAPNGTYRYNYYFSDGERLTYNYKGFNTGNTSNNIEEIAGDFNGNGKYEILIKDSQRLYDENGNLIATGGITWGQRHYDELPYDRNIIDFNGNGKLDLLVLDNSGYRVYELNGSSFTLICSGTDLKYTSSFDYSPLVGDFNGDGNSDILVQRYSTNEYYILFSKGTAFEKKSLPNLNITGKWFAADFNRDGRTDIIHCSRNNGYGFPMRIGLFDGQGFQFETVRSDLITASDMNMETSWKYLYFSDFNGDGVPEICFTRYIDALILKSLDKKQNLLLQSITDGLNRRISFTYTPMTSSDVYSRTTESHSFPVISMQVPLYLVKSMSIMNNSGFNDHISYYYTDARIHRQGKGFLGFGQVEQINYQQNRKTITHYDHNTFYYMVYTTKQEVKNYSGTTDISTVDYTNNYLYVAPKRFFPYVSRQVTTDHLTGLTVTTEHQYKAATVDHGNPYKITETRGDMKTETTISWIAKGSIFKNRPENIQIKRSGLQGTYTETTTLQYDDKGRVLSNVEHSGTNAAVTTTYSRFNKFGFPETITTNANNCPTVTVTSQYDAYGRQTGITDASGTTGTQYDIFGRVKMVTRIDNLTSGYEYDGFGQIIKETLPSGNTVSFARAWDISSSQVYRIDRTEQGAPSRSVWYNATGQEIKSRTKGFSGDIYTKKEYNGKGQLYRSYLPGYGNPDSKYTEYIYDVYGRLGSEISIAGTTGYVYSGNTTTVNYPDNTFRTTTLNNAGLIESITDGGGTISYIYNSLGKPATATTNGSTTTFRYDNRGNRIALKDPNTRDTLRYVFDAYGKLRNRTNARGQQTSFLYDAAGRVISENIPEMNLTYEYVSSGNGKGQLEKIKTGNTELRKITYNNLSMPKEIMEKIDGTDYITEYSYDRYGRPLEKKSPSGFRLSHHYTGDGYLSALYDAANNTMLWQAGTVNALGNVTSSTLGNGLIRNTEYDSNMMLQNISLNNGASKVDEIAYNFTVSSGNLQQRNDKTLLRKEDFGYDGLKRLNSISLNNAAAQSVVYKPDGSIESKYDVGTYLYGSNNHAVSGINNLATGYSPRMFELEHTSFNRTSSVAMDGQRITFAYGPDKQRNISRFYESAGVTTPQTTRYYNGNYEKEVTGNSIKEYDYIYSPEGLVAITVTSGGARSLYYAHTDHLGSLRVLSDGSKNISSRYHYDAWGKRTRTAGSDITMRGFTGHEHLDGFGLVNMNARMYDPVLGRFLSIDPYVQMPDNTQSFNRYSYCLNNPLAYTDPSGEFFLWTIITGIVDFFATGLFQWDWKNYDPTASWSNTNKAWQIDLGQFRSDPNKDGWGRFWEVISRFTWQAPQTAIGYTGAGVQNLFDGVKSVTNYGGATVIETYGKWKEGGGVTFGSYIFGERGIQADPKNSLFQHEYGHYLQSQATGWYYLTNRGLQSLFSQEKKHSHNRVEQDANIRAFKYFHKYEKELFDVYDKKSGAYIGKWDYNDNPILDYNWLIHYDSEHNQDVLRKRKMKLQFEEYFGSFSVP